MSWLPAQAAGATPLDRVFGLRPNLYESYRGFVALFWERRLVDPLLLELCRLLVARLHGCRSELVIRYRPAVEAGLDEEKVQALARWAEAPFGPVERICLGFAERFVRDPHSISDTDAAAVVAQLGEPGFVALVEALAIFDGFCRFRLMLGAEPASEEVVVLDAPRPGDASAH
jgi:alkylhydroperoxidase family enzyme